MFPFAGVLYCGRLQRELLRFCPCYFCDAAVRTVLAFLLKKEEEP